MAALEVGEFRTDGGEQGDDFQFGLVAVLQISVEIIMSHVKRAGVRAAVPTGWVFSKKNTRLEWEVARTPRRDKEKEFCRREEIVSLFHGCPYNESLERQP